MTTLPPHRDPERTCVGCRGRGGKARFVRVVRTPAGRVEVDPTGKAPGRGAYVHRDGDCIHTALRRGSMARALRATLGEAEAARLMEQLLESVGDDR